MMNSISDLNNYLFETLERLVETESEEEIEKETKRSKAITGVANVIINNGRLALDTMKHLNDYEYKGYNTEDNANLAPVPQMLRVKTNV